MKKIIFTFLIICLFPVQFLLSQPLFYSETFESYDTLTLPTDWFKKNNRPYGVNDEGAVWVVRDTNMCVPGIQCTRTARAYQSLKAIACSWWAIDTSTGILADAWLLTKKFNTIGSDYYMSFYASGGSASYADSMQILISPTGDTAISSFQYLESIHWPVGSVFGNFEPHVIDLSTFAGTTPRIAFRYYMDCTQDGFVVFIDDVQLFGTVGISQIGNNIPKSFALHQNYPNPFNPITKIKFDVPKNTNVRIEIYNNLGQVVAVPHTGYTTAGYYEVSFDGSKLTSGIYYYRFASDNFTETKKMILVK